MKTFAYFGLWIFFAAAWSLTNNLNAQQISAQITSDEAYVGAPIQLQIKISNANDYDLPDAPTIEGCKVEFLGVPSRSSQVTISGGQRYKTTSVTAVYSITAMRAGEFVIPELEITVNGETRKLAEYPFSAIKSETGDLLYVEIEGQQDSVYVGQPLDLRLKIFLKPFRDAEHNVTMKIRDMWSTVSGNSSWGSFLGRLQEMAESRTRPNGREVIRNDANGTATKYYLFEVDSTIYPNRPGKIDGNGVQIVVDYPEKIGRPNPSFDDFFLTRRSSRLAVTKTRPIVASAVVDATEVLPIPTAGRPVDYRGAVGKYQMIAEAEPRAVAVEDPITLRLAIVGDGPMELIQAPPLSEIGSLTSDFKTEDQNLAGFVKGNAKIFVTTIRPRRAGIEKIPAIPFSFFDPDGKQFKTVYTDPIEITVSESDELSLDSIVGNLRESQRDGSSASGNSQNEPATETQFANVFAETVLRSRQSKAPIRWWIWLAWPPILWFTALVFKSMTGNCRFYSWINSSSVLARRRINKASRLDELIPPFNEYIFNKFKLVDTPTTEAAIGTLRSHGHMDLAIEAENLMAEALRFRAGDVSENQLMELKNRYCQLIEDIETEARAETKQSIRRLNQNRHRSFIPEKFLIVWLVIGSGLLAAPTMASETSELTDVQKKSIFMEANEYYRKGQTDSSVEDFKKAAEKYALLIQSGIKNADLFLNLGNAQLQSGQPAFAIASYLRGLKLAPYHRALSKNLRSARDVILESSDQEIKTQSDVGAQLADWNQLFIATVAWPIIFGLAMVSSVVFWGSLLMRTIGFRFKIGPALFVSGLILLISTVSLWLDSHSFTSVIAIAVKEEIQLRPGDGDEFQVTRTISSTIGSQFNVLTQRNGWVRIETSDGETGWTSINDLEVIEE